MCQLTKWHISCHMCWDENCRIVDGMFNIIVIWMVPVCSRSKLINENWRGYYSFCCAILSGAPKLWPNHNLFIFFIPARLNCGQITLKHNSHQLNRQYLDSTKHLFNYSFKKWVITNEVLHFLFIYSKLFKTFIKVTKLVITIFSSVKLVPFI